jgi:uncharacterized cupredoxin-like copper-binding protein
VRPAVPLRALLGAMVLLLAGCSTDTTVEATTQLSVEGTDRLAFEPTEFAVPAGEEVTLRLTAGEAVGHDFVVEGAEAQGAAGDQSDEGGAVAAGDLAVAHADPGQTVTGTFTIDRPGTYEVYCSIPGHREAGMAGILTVAAGA